MREGCPFCVIKHLSQASVLMDECALGYPHHRWLAVGHLCEAEAECVQINFEFACKIRETRIKIMHTKENPIIEKLLIEFLKLINEYEEPSQLNSKKIST